MYAEIRAALTMLASNHSKKVPYKVYTLLTFTPSKKGEVRNEGKTRREKTV